MDAKFPIAVVKAPLAVVFLPTAVEASPLAVVWTPSAVELMALAVVFWPIAVDQEPLAVVPLPSAVELWPLAVVLTPVAVEALPLAVVLMPIAKDWLPTFASSHRFPVTRPARNAAFRGYHITRTPAPVTGMTPDPKVPVAAHPSGSVITTAGATPSPLPPPLQLNCTCPLAHSDRRPGCLIRYTVPVAGT